MDPSYTRPTRRQSRPEIEEAILSLPHRAWRTLPTGFRRDLAITAPALLAPGPDRPFAPRVASGVLIGGETGRASGLGEGARLMAAAARTLGVAVRTIDTGLVPRAERAEIAAAAASSHSDDVSGAPLILHNNPATVPLVALRLGRPTLRGRRVIGYWAWELPAVPPAWRHVARFVHEAWAPSRFTADALATLLGPGRVRVVPHPLAAAPPAPGPERRADFGLPDAALVVLASFSVASSFARKNPLAAIDAFRRAFGARPDRVLVLKASRGDHAPDDMKAIREAIDGAPNIRIETRVLPRPTADALTATADIVLSLHRSEGFGLVPAEAMLLGRPVVATDWSGTTDFLDASCAVPVPFRLVPARDPRGVFAVPGAVWADADIDAAADALRRLAADPALRRRLGASAERRARERFGTGPLRVALAANGVVVR